MSMEINGSYNHYKAGYVEAMRAEQDKNSNAKDVAAAPQKSGSPEKLKKSDDVKRCTGNTDAVDREIKTLKERKEQLERQIQMAAGDENKVRELEKELEQLESELIQKDNDAYRRQHTSFSEWV